MKLHRFTALMKLPLSNKILALRHAYWAMKTNILYRWLFHHFGKGSRIYKPMFICNADCIEIGDQVLIWDGIRLEAVRDPFGRTPRLTIGSNTSIQQNVHIVCHGRVSIGENVMMAACSSIVDVTHPYDTSLTGNIGCLIKDEDSHVEVGDGVFIGYGAIIMPNVRIGKRAVIGANAVVTKDIPDFAVAAGAPARVIRIYSPSRGR